MTVYSQKAPGSEEQKWHFLFILKQAQLATDFSSDLTASGNFLTEINAGACDFVTVKSQRDNTDFPTAPWLSSGINNCNLCGEAKSSNHRLTINGLSLLLFNTLALSLLCSLFSVCCGYLVMTYGQGKDSLCLSRTRRNNLIIAYSSENEPAWWSVCFVLPDRQLLHQPHSISLHIPPPLLWAHCSSPEPSCNWQLSTVSLLLIVNLHLRWRLEWSFPFAVNKCRHV